MYKHLFIGIDGGASFCRARIRDMQGNLLGEGWGGPANIHLDLVLAAQSIRAASKAAARVAGLDERSLQRTHAGLGLAGAGIKSACDDLRSKLGPFASVVLETDAYIAWLGAHRAADGGIVILGTGSCGLAVVNGQRITVGGYGPEVSDEAGGQRIGREALRRALWAFDGRVRPNRAFGSRTRTFRVGSGKNRLFCFEGNSGRLCRTGATGPRVCIGEGSDSRRYNPRGGRRRRTNHRTS